MSPALAPRQYYGYGGYGSNQCYNSYQRQYYYCSNWDRWGRWVLLAVIIAVALLVFFLFSCITARRRRKLGYQPYRGTAWTLGRPPAGHGQAKYNNTYPQQEQQPYYNNSNNPAPAYQQTGNSNAGYYGNDNSAPVAQPGATYSGYNSGHAQYQPPAGKPPGQY